MQTSQTQDKMSQRVQILHTDNPRVSSWWEQSLWELWRKQEDDVFLLAPYLDGCV